MAIRFQCSSCVQPIEVDDEWAGKLVACPYCRKTVTAPIQSTLDAASPIPEATRLDPGTAVQPFPQGSEWAAGPASPNTIAVVALVLAGLMVLLLVISQLVLGAHHNEIEPLLEAIAEAPDFVEAIRIQADFYDRQGGVPAWQTTAMLLIGGSFLAWIAAIVCGVIGVRHVHRRPLAVAALALAGALPILYCCGGALGLGG